MLLSALLASTSALESADPDKDSRGGRLLVVGRGGQNGDRVKVGMGGLERGDSMAAAAAKSDHISKPDHLTWVNADLCQLFS